MSNRGKRKAMGTAGAKTLLTVLALVGTVVGWAELTKREGAEAADPSPTLEPVVFELPPVPTLVPEPTAIDAPPVTAQPTPTRPVLRVVNEPVKAPSSASRGGGGGSSSSRSS